MKWKNEERKEGRERGFDWLAAYSRIFVILKYKSRKCIESIKSIYHKEISDERKTLRRELACIEIAYRQ